MKNRFVDVDFTKEPYKSMVDPKQPEKSKQTIIMFVYLCGEPDKNGKFHFKKEELPEIYQKLWNQMIIKSGMGQDLGLN